MNYVYSCVLANMDPEGDEKVQRHINRQAEKGMTLAHYSVASYMYTNRMSQESNAVLHNFVWTIVDAREALEAFRNG